ncbi:arabinofuranosyltransferase [Blastococcus sp. URHD0036]|uniref:arabinofuranosyltransferase n=1 Tax=Blastococcus sp. URHD0036 TaxID=1380356 RepID=UPI00049731F9|nr:arabinofuranosyltransferase [Blastococcus sp. URHD0036]
MSTDTGSRPVRDRTVPADPAQPDPGASRPRAAGPREGRWLLGGLAAVVLAVLVSVAVQVVVDRVPVSPNTNVPVALMDWATVAGLAVAAVLLLRTRMPALVREGLAVAVLAALGTTAVALSLTATDYYLMGLSEDQLFRTQYLTRLTDSAALADINYADISPFYPPGWFWLGGRLADLFGVPAWLFYKPWALTTLGVVPVAAYWVWRRLVGPRLALCIGLVVVAAGLGEAATEPYSWAIAALLPAAVVVFWRSVAPGARRRWPHLVGLGVFIGASLSVYTLLGGFAAAVLAGLAVAGAWLDGPGNRRAGLARTLPALAVVAGTAAVVAAPAWARYVLAVLQGEGGDNAAARFLPLQGAQLPAPMLEPSVWGAFLAVGLVYVVWQGVVGTGRDAAICRPLALLVGGVYAWFGLSTLALGLDTTLLAFRTEPVLETALAAAAVLALRRAWELARRRWPVRSDGQVRGVFAVLTVLGILLGTVTLRDNVRELDPQVAVAHNDPYPSGLNARGLAVPDADEGWIDGLAAAIDTGTGQPADELVVLTTNYPLLAVYPYRGFQANAPHYANPLADYTERSQFVETLATSSSQAEFLARLDAAPWRAPTVFVLRPEDDGLHLELRSDTFPGSPNIHLYDVVFDPAVFAGWYRQDVGPFAVLVRPGS